MKFRLETFWLFLLTVGGNQKQLSADCCHELLATWGMPAAAATTIATAPARQKSIEPTTNHGNELENAMELRETARQPMLAETQPVIGDITTTIRAQTQPDATTTLKSFARLTLRQAKATASDLQQNLKDRLASLLASEESDFIPLTTTTTTTSAVSDSDSSQAGETTHHPERRHAAVEKLQYTKEIQIKQGRLMGITRRFQVTSGLREVDQFLGLPYAEAPTGSRRFMPPGAPLPWQGLKIARHLPPVCPQKLPDVSSKNISRGRRQHLSRLMPYLKVESEDCLYLNLYVPHEVPSTITTSSKLHAVLVYLHGESFEWNSGNAYDGSVLASYGDVIVVTVNYRLGVLGFMRPSIDAHNIANYALLDQMAALHWIKENIGSFGGDSERVTLMGHSTGAACVNYLMVSPVSSGLFHRAILMSGSAMSDWAASNQSLQLTMQIAHALNCPLSDHEEEDDALLNCLRQRRYQDILHIPTSFQQFSTSLGPIVDGHVIPNQPYKVMAHNTEYFSRYDLLFGITESESYHTLAALALDEGLRENERDNLLRFYMQTRFDVRPDLALAATLKKYQDMYNNPIKATNLEHRDVVLDILSDARVVGPLLQTGAFHADVPRRNYMYVFGHNSATGPYANLPHSIMGEELAFVFGAPLAPAGPFPSHNYSVQEKLLSEAVMAYWTNFVKTGNPKDPWKRTFLNSHALEWDRYDLDWPEFNRRSQAYLNIGIPPTVGYKYRGIYMNFWNKELPDELNQIAAIQEQQQHQQQQQSTMAGNEVITGHMSKYGARDNGAEDPVRTLKLLLQDPLSTVNGNGNGNSNELTETAAENMYNAPPTFGHVHRQQQQGGGVSGEEVTQPGLHAPDYGEDGNAAFPVAPSEPIAKSETTLQLLIALIAIFIVLNVAIYATFLLRQRRKRSTSLQRKLGGGNILSYDGANDDELKRCSKSRDGDDSYVLDVVRKSNTYEAIKTGQRSPINGYAMQRQLSTSTVDTHTKVCEWMSAQNHNQNQNPAKSGSFHTTPPPPPAVAQLDAGRIIICQDIEVADAALLTPQHMHDLQPDAMHYELLLQRQHSALTEPSEATLLHSHSHSHSHSDPVDMILAADEQVTSFVHADDVDINVTSRDEESLHLQPLTAQQQLDLLRQRNYPKVLPTAQDLRSGGGSHSYKRNSLPPQNFIAPLPPPRTVSSTLGRRRRDSSNVTTSPLMLAQDVCGEDEPKEPQITQNTLIVGPIVPKSPATSLKRPKRSEPNTTNTTAISTLSGSFQSFESVPPAHEATPPQGQRTECVYAIAASASVASMPGSWSAPNGDLYAQPSKSASRTSLIPRLLQASPETSDSPTVTTAATVTTTTAPTTTTTVTTPSRIPQLQRQASNKDMADQDLTVGSSSSGNHNNSNCNSRIESTISNGSSCCSSGTSSSSSTGTVRTELQQCAHSAGKSITTNI